MDSSRGTAASRSLLRADPGRGGRQRVAVIGAGIGGLAASLLLAAHGFEVTVFEQQPVVGGKIRTLIPGGLPIDSGPTVLTLPGIIEEIFEAAGSTLERHLRLVPARILGRHAWAADAPERPTCLDLHADPGLTEEAIGAFAGSGEARAFRRFRKRAERTFTTLSRAFIGVQHNGPLSLLRRAGLRELLAIDAFSSLSDALAREFRDRRLRQLFGRYATYCGSSPFEAPATLMLVAHVEQRGVWLVEGGMVRLVHALATLAEARGVRFRLGEPVASILVERGRAAGVVTRAGERFAAGSVLCNADVAALGLGLFGEEARCAVDRPSWRARSLSALTWSIEAEADGFALLRHNVFFSSDYGREFADLAAGRLPSHPTVYVCAQDREARPERPGVERLFCIVNAPPRGDQGAPGVQEEQECLKRTMQQLRDCGLRIAVRSMAQTGPRQFAQLFPGGGGGLYGQAAQGWRSAFQRPQARSRLPGLFLAGGSTHPGPGVPMAALSGRMAAAAIIADCRSNRSTSRRPSRQAATAGGTSTG